MKNELEIKLKLEEIYNHRLSLRIERKTKKTCKNCKKGIENDYNLGEFGNCTKWECCLPNVDLDTENCKFECKNSVEQIEKEMLSDISNPSICGAKEPKIAALLWVLHHNENNKLIESQQNNKKNSTKKTIWSKIFGYGKE